MFRLIVVLVAFAVFSPKSGKAEIPHQFLDAETLELNQKVQTTKIWKNKEKEEVKKYFIHINSIAPKLVKLLKSGEHLGPINVLRVSKSPWSLGFAKQKKRGEKTYLVIADMFFKASNKTTKGWGYDGGNFVTWFFVHELVHLSEFRTSVVNKPLFSVDPAKESTRLLRRKILLGKAILHAKKSTLGVMREVMIIRILT